MDFVTGLFQGGTGTEHIQTGRPTLSGALGAHIGKTASDYMSNPNYNAMAKHDRRTISAPAKQIAMTSSIGKVSPDLYLPPAPGKS